MRIFIIILLCVLLMSCAMENKTTLRPTIYYKDWCGTCGNKGFIDCNTCWSGKTIGDLKCYKCGGAGRIICPDCLNKRNIQGEEKRVKQKLRR